MEQRPQRWRQGKCRVSKKHVQRRQALDIQVGDAHMSDHTRIAAEQTGMVFLRCQKKATKDMPSLQ